MPQLNPIPWFMILTFSCEIVVFLTPTKVFGRTKPNELTLMDTKKYQSLNWTWPW
uniref:ATP synthase F0 subunit 8 n=1 Tax=Rasbora borneensis TaxID=2713759 RepID=UPI002028E124|nr:ATP synthase F0 subunit 8 [Rasbora borneensis]UQJ78884.1 ATP synthase F0 subunit 8 [Rasbora borneensis]